MRTSYLLVVACFVGVVPGSSWAQQTLDCATTVERAAAAFVQQDHDTFLGLVDDTHNGFRTELLRKARAAGESPEDRDDSFETSMEAVLTSFPRIGGLPAWVPRAEVRYTFLRGNTVFEVDADFENDGGHCRIHNLRIDTETVSDEAVTRLEGSLSLAPPDGGTTLDLGLGPLLQQMIADQLADVQAGSLLEIIGPRPDIGVVPAPIQSFALDVEGLVEVTFRWDARGVVCDRFELETATWRSTCMEQIHEGQLPDDLQAACFSLCEAEVVRYVTQIGVAQRARQAWANEYLVLPGLASPTPRPRESLDGRLVAFPGEQEPAGQPWAQLCWGPDPKEVYGTYWVEGNGSAVTVYGEIDCDADGTRTLYKGELSGSGPPSVSCVSLDDSPDFRR